MEETRDLTDLISISGPKYDTEAKLHLDMSHFSAKQMEYLDMLTKYSPKQKRVKFISRSDISRREEVYIKENFGYLNVNEQVDFNDSKNDIERSKTNSYGIGIGVFVLSFGYYIVKTPVTKGLLKEGCKSLGFGLVGAYGYYKYKYNEYLDTLYYYYREIIQAKKRRREIRSAAEMASRDTH